MLNSHKWLNVKIIQNNIKKHKKNVYIFGVLYIYIILRLIILIIINTI